MSHTTAILVAEQPTVLAVHQNDCSSNQRHQEQGDPASPDAEQQQHTVSDLESSQTREPIITGASACRSQRSCRQDGRPEDIANDQSRGDAGSCADAWGRGRRRCGRDWSCRLDRSIRAANPRRSRCRAARRLGRVVTDTARESPSPHHNVGRTGRSRLREGRPACCITGAIRSAASKSAI